MLKTSRTPALPRRSQRGLSLVELMVGITVGLFVVAGATFVVSAQLGDNRRLLLETQLHQDLRATVDIVTREMRRAGATLAPEGMVWQQGSVPQPDAHQTVTLADGGREVGFQFERAPGITGPFGYRLDGGVVKSRIGAAGWQELTDRAVMDVLAFTIATDFSPPQTLPCPRGCGGDPTDTTCWPQLTVRSYVVDITARSRADPAVQRRLTSRVRLGNDLLESRLGPGIGGLCP
ncbi:MAG: prepilin-type N-terminal cleavage/methylation domain-containing protein [Burkholderiales bacterium]|nr:prepilin-type N-terminal cleavage/methylation domain-containing protein [Burkholderiales bacterium]